MSCSLRGPLATFARRLVRPSDVSAHLSLSVSRHGPSEQFGLSEEAEEFAESAVEVFEVGYVVGAGGVERARVVERTEGRVEELEDGVAEDLSLGAHADVACAVLGGGVGPVVECLDHLGEIRIALAQPRGPVGADRRVYVCGGQAVPFGDLEDERSQEGLRDGDPDSHHALLAIRPGHERTEESSRSVRMFCSPWLGGLGARRAWWV
jgi:hypothetical protein